VDARVEQRIRVVEPEDLSLAEREWRRSAEERLRVDPQAERRQRQCPVEIDLAPLGVLERDALPEPFVETGPWFRQDPREPELAQHPRRPPEVRGPNEEIEVPVGAPRRVGIERVGPRRALQHDRRDAGGRERGRGVQQQLFEDEHHPHRRPLGSDELLSLLRREVERAVVIRGQREARDPLPRNRPQDMRPESLRHASLERPAPRQAVPRDQPEDVGDPRRLLHRPMFARRTDRHLEAAWPPVLPGLRAYEKYCIRWRAG
jgi:hypothetical protein